ncbi:MAG TPA: GNAT family N-acetyltransferase [Terriglobia bacterium]|nr:GNAT family N-acetyltransferase [Terriglobia bacterium]
MNRIVPAAEPAEIETVRALFREYADSLGVDLCFQGFEKELAELPGDYAPPSGRLYLAYVKDALAGCVGLRKIGDSICEMKRLYVRPLHRGQGIGRQLVLKLIEDARSLGYTKMRLDTLPSMKRAQELYRDMGFKPTEPYRANPVPGALFLELDIP